MPFYDFIIFVFGLIVGSFLNVVIYRLENDQSFIGGRSYCPNCKHTLSWRDLIPVFSFLILRGKCRYCQNKISFQYPLVELATGILFLFSAYQNLNPVYYFFIVAVLLVIFVIDLRNYIIPDLIIYPAIILVFAYNILNSESVLISLLAGLGSAAFFFTIFLISRGRWLGFGDVKLVFFMGMFLGFPNIMVGLFLAVFIGAIIGIILIVLGRKKLKSEIPFGPFLIAGTFLALFFGQNIINWYLNQLY